jgi:hypothetical protein
MLRAPSKLALTGAMDRRIVNIADDAPSTLYEMARAVGITIESSVQPLKESCSLPCHVRNTVSAILE